MSALMRYEYAVDEAVRIGMTRGLAGSAARLWGEKDGTAR
jgi:hypothetical protein